MSKRDLLFNALPLLVLLTGWIFRKPVGETLRRFLGETSSPVDLAVIRVVVFAVIFYHADPVHARFFGGLPDELYRLPLGFDVIQPLLLGKPEQAYWLAVGLQISAAMACVGLFTRWAAWATVALATLVFGIAQCVGKVNHDTHHLIWFAALLALSPSAHSLSVDRLIHAWRKPKQWGPDADQPSAAFGRPIRLAMLLIGLVYFYPGAAKLILGGPQWWSAENTVRLMHGDWVLSGFVPGRLRVDQIPFVAMLGSIGTIVFELFFLAALFHVRTRVLAALSGFAFHNMTFLTMHIHFTSLQSMYVIFVPWGAVAHSIGRRFRARSMVVMYDGGCGMCQRTVASLRSLDTCGLVDFRDLHGGAFPGSGEHPDLDAMVRDIQGYCAGRWVSGVETYAEISKRVPLLWWAWPLLKLPGCSAVATRVYRRVADSRACRIPLKGSEAPVEQAPAPSPSRGAPVLATLIAIGVTVMTWARIGAAWPISMMPTYVWYAEDTAKVLSFKFTRDDGSSFELQPVSDLRLRYWFYRNRVSGMHQWILTDEAKLTVRARALARVWNDQVLHEPVRQVEVFRSTIWTAPSRWDEAPTKRESVAKFEL